MTIMMAMVEDIEQPEQFSMIAGTLAAEHQLSLICAHSAG